MSENNLAIKVSFEVGQLDKLLEDATPLINLCATKEPDFVETLASASILHSFYNGLESIFLLYAKSEDFTFKSSAKWHAELLLYAKKRFKFSEEVFGTLSELLAFRHFFRHTYGNLILWSKCKHLFLAMGDFWQKVKSFL